jgi:hypothetical protein
MTTPATNNGSTPTPRLIPAPRPDGGSWTEAIAPIVSKLKLAYVVGVPARIETDGAKELATMLTRMAHLLDTAKKDGITGTEPQVPADQVAWAFTAIKELANLAEEPKDKLGMQKLVSILSAVAAEAGHSV